MMLRTLVLNIDESAPDMRKVRKAAAAIKRGGLVVFPTETVYGLGANAFSAEACSMVFAVKGRSRDNPLLVHVSSFAQAERLCSIPKKYGAVLKRLWPAPLTIVAKARDPRLSAATAGLDTVAVRMPMHKVALALIRSSGVPIAGPSANVSETPSATRAGHALRQLRGKVDVIIDSGPSRYGLESTILDLSTFTILRPGSFTVEEIESAFGRRPRVPAAARGVTDSKKALSPGMKYRHYAPRTPLFVYGGRIDALPGIVPRGRRFAFIGSDESCAKMRGKAAVLLRLGPSAQQYRIAGSLFDRLIGLDDHGVDFAIAESCGEHGIGLAIMNRLRKASNHRSFSTGAQLARLLALTRSHNL